MFGSSIEPGSPSRSSAGRAPSRASLSCAFVPSVLVKVVLAKVVSAKLARLARVALTGVVLAGVVGCGENVLVGNWQLRSLSDAGLDLPEDADAGPNLRADRAQAARNKQKLKSEQKNNRASHQNDQDTKPGH